MADVEIAFVHDFGAEEEFVAQRGAGARLNGRPLRAEGPGRGIEVVGLESAEPGAILAPLKALAGRAKRIRAVGAIAISLCYVASGRFDGMFSARVCRSVDVAAGQLVVREAGARVEFSGGSLEETPLDLSARFKVAAGLEPDVLATMREVQRAGDRG
jgi:myo-inositol-1(or 4)-monophosphatase